MKWAGLGFLLWMGLLGCRTPSMDSVWLGRGVPFALRDPKAGPHLSATQHLAFSLPGGRSETLVLSLENNSDHMSVVASSPLGQTLFTVQIKDGSTVGESRIPLPKEFDVRLLPALVQLADWPLEELRKGLAQDSEILETGNVREVRRQGRTIAIIRREGTAPPYLRITIDLPAASIHAVMTTLDE